MCALLPRDFWPLTPFEALALIEGGASREEREWERVAFLAANLMNIEGKSLKRPVTADQLLGRKREVKVIDPEAKFEELRRRLEARQEARDP